MDPFPKIAAREWEWKRECLLSRFSALRFARVRFEPLSGHSFKGNGEPLGFQRCASRERDGLPLRGWGSGEWIHCLSSLSVFSAALRASAVFSASRVQPFGIGFMEFQSEWKDYNKRSASRFARCARQAADCYAILAYIFECPYIIIPRYSYNIEHFF